jgi:hypothetical protein
VGINKLADKGTGKKRYEEVDLLDLGSAVGFFPSL